MANFDDLVDPFDSPIPQKKTGLLRKAGDLAAGIGSGAVGATKALSDAFGADNAASKALGGVNEGLQGLLSPETVVRQYQQSRIMDEAKGQGIGGQVAAGLKAFAVDPAQTIAQGAGSIAPFIAAQFVPGVGQSATAARALQLGMGVGTGAGTAKGAIFDEVKKRELAAGRTPDQAQAAADAAQSYGGANTDQIAFGAGLGLADAALGATPAAVSALRRSLGKEAIEGIGKPTTDGIIKAGIKGAAGEMPVEFAQGAQEQVAANIAAQRTGYDAGTWDGAISQGTLEGLAAAGPGAGFGILNRGQAPAAEQPPAQPPVAPTTTPGAPPAATPPTDPTLGQSLTGTPMADLMGGSGLTGGANPLQAGLSTLTSDNQMYPGINTEPTGYTVDPETGAIIPADPVGVRQMAEPAEQVEAPAPVAQAPVAPAPAPPALGESLTGTPVADMLGSGGMSGPANPLQSVLDARTPSQRMGLNPESGGLTAAAAIAVDSGASPVTIGMGLRALSGAAPAAQPVSEQATQQQQAQPPAQQPILNNGKPFTLAEVGQANQAIGGTAVSVPGGWAIQPPQAAQKPAATPDTAMQPAATPAASAQSAILGRNSQPIAEGGQPFATREEAKAEKRLQPLMRVAPAEGGGFILKPASERQLAAVEKAVKRLKYPSTGETGPRSLHGFILQIGGLASGAMPDVGFDLNPRVGNRRLFSPRGKTIEQAAMAAKQEGYIQDEDENTLIEALKRSLNVSPVYTPDGYEAMAEAQMQARYEDFLAAEQDGGAENDWSRLTPEELAETGYNDYDEATQAEIRALVAQAEALGVDAESILEDVAQRTENATQKDYENAAKSAIEAAIRSSEESRSRDLGQAGAEAGPAAADTPAAPAAVTGQASDVRARNLAALKARMMAGQTKPTPATPPAQTKASPAPEAGPTNQGATNGRGQETLLKAEQPTGAAAMVSGAPVADTSLNRDSSWVIREKATGKVVMETFDRAKVDALNTAKYEAVPIQRHLAEQGAKNPSDTTKPGGFTERVQKAAGKVDAAPAQPILTSPTKADIEAQQARAEQAAKAKAAQDKADAARAAKERERKEVAAASVAAAGTFELGQDAMANLTGQQDVFGAMEQEAKPVVSANTVFTEDAAAKARARLKSKLGRLNSGLDPEMMMDGITLAGYHIEKGARTFAAYARAMIEDLGDGVKPYLKSWYMGVKYDPRAASFDGMDGAAAVEAADINALTAQQETQDVPSPNTSVERNSRQPATEPAVGDVVQNGQRPDSAGDNQVPGQPSGSDGGRQPDGAGVQADSPVVDGIGGDLSVHSGDAKRDAAVIATGAEFSERGSGIGNDGVSAEPVATGKVAAVAQSSSEKNRLALKQKQADSIGLKYADLDNIKATLPMLLDGQQEDVFKAETRFQKPYGYGMLFTNGTGTGKTFTGLGIIKRMARQGKTNILVVVPDEKIGDDWIGSAKLLGLNASKLADTKDAGKGIVLTTYANLGSNDALATRAWDLVVADEAHNLMKSADGTVTTYLQNLRAITMHPDGAFQRYAMLNREKIDRSKALSEEITGLERMIAADSTTDQQRAAWDAKSEALQKELGALRGELDKALNATRADVKANQGAKRTRLAALSATPFAYEFTIDWANGYLFDYNDGQASDETESRGYNSGSNRERFFMQHFGYSMRYNKLTKPDPTKVDTGLMQRSFNTMLKKAGSLSGRMLDVKADYDRRFVLVDSAIGNQIDEALNWISDMAGDSVPGFSTLRDVIGKKFDYLSRRYLLEAIKAKEAVPIVRKHMEMGRKVVVFHDYKKGGGFNPFNVSMGDAAGLDSATEDTKALAAAIDSFKQKFAALVNTPFQSLLSPIEVFSNEFPGVLLINGDEKKPDLLARYKAFQDDATGPQVALVQSAKNAGWSGHDTTGKHQRVLINLGQPTAPTLAIQQEGRIYRTGQVSNAIMRYMNTGTNWEKWAFATTIAGRASAAENLGMGELSRALKDSFIGAFEESDAYPPGHEGEGTGGKERDAAQNNQLTAWDRAKSLYWATQKKNSRTKAQEGVDYFATPEPVGMKMAEWLGSRGGERTLEPSAGHGAIARWLPETTKRTVIEPSNTLRSRLALVMNPSDDRILDVKFEALDAVNKFDGIAMNPPFGVGGKTAIEHLAKAATHLSDGGRIVALIPTGPAADKRFDQWMYGEQEAKTKPLGSVVVDGKETFIYKGDTIELQSGWAPPGVVIGWRQGVPLVKPTAPEFRNTAAVMVDSASIKSVKETGPRTEKYRAAKDMYTVGEALLPSVTFERAGTAVSTRIVVLEKQSKAENAPNQKATIDLSGLSDINDLFGRMENLTMPERKMTEAQKAEVEAEQKQAEASAVKTERNEAAKKQSAAVGDKVTLAGKEYDVVVYTTNAGKDIRGAWVKTKELATRFNDRTFQKKPLGWFVREKDFHRTDANQKPSVSRAKEQPLTPAATIRAAITNAYGNLLDKLEAKGLVTIAQTEREAIEAAAQARADKTGDDAEAIAGRMMSMAGLDVKYSANGNIEGFFDKQTGKSFLVADNLTAASAPGTLMHEVGIHMAAGGKLEALFKRAGSLLKTGTQNEFIQRVKARMARAGETSDEEAAAYIVTEYENDRAKAPITIGKWLADLTAAVRAWLFSKGIILKADQLTVADIAAVARANARSMARGGSNGGPGGGQAFSRNVGDAAPDEAQRVQAAIEGKSLIEAAMFLTRSSNKANAAIAQKVAEKLKRMEAIGVDLNLHIVHRGDMAPAALANSRGYTESGFDSKGRDVAVWLNGADVAGKVGTEEEVLLHELAHAATTGMVHYGAMNPDTQAGRNMKDLMAVTDAIADHIKQRFADAETGKVTLTEFELDMREGANNAFRSDDEVLAWALSNAEAQQYLEGIPYKSGSLWSNFVRSVRALLGMSPEMDTALSEVLRVAERLLTDDQAKTGRSAFWHKRGLRMIQQQGRGSIVQTQTRSALPATLNIDGKDRPTTNSNGQPIHPTEEGVRNFWRWFSDSKVVDADGRPLVVYHGTASDVDMFDAKKTGSATKAKSADGVFWFSDSAELAEDYAGFAKKKFGKNGARNIMPVYLQMSDPKIVDMGGKEYRELSFDFGGFVQTAKKGVRSGTDWVVSPKDGVILRNFSDTPSGRRLVATHYAVFLPDQIKSATGNTGAFSPTDPDIRFSRAADMAGNAIDKAKQTADKAMGKDFPRAASMPDLNDDQRSLLGKVGASQSPASDAIKAATDRAGLKIRQSMVDRFAALKELDEKALGQNFIADAITNSAWVLAKMSSAGSGALNAMMKTGRIEMDAQQKVIGLKGAPNGGLTASLQKLGGPAEVERFFAWVAANRADKLMVEGRENLFTPAEIAAGKTLNTGTTEGGKVRPALYSQVHAEFQQYRDDVLAIAEQTGIINGENRAMWRDEFYVPFYRVMEDDADRGRSGGNGLSRQEAYKKLKGGKQNLNDLMENTLMNFHHLLSASLKNQAAVQAIKNAEAVGIARKVPEARRDTKTSTFVLVDGKKVFYEVDDPLVFESITTLADPGLNNTAVRVMGAFKRLFTNMTTATPQFIIANTFRDLLQASATSPTSKNIAKNLKEGIQSYRDEKTRAEMLASGGAFSFGHIYGMGADEVKASLQKTVAGAGLISSPSMIPSMMRKMWDAWSNITDLSENASRAATYTQNVDELGKLRAAFEARDVMDFSQHGAWPAVRLLVRIVPFLNARLQGLDKLYRSGLKPSILTAMGKGTDTDKQAAARFAMVTGALTLATMALYLINADDDEYKKLEEWQKDTYWFIRIGENAFFLPKPFEVGAIATVAERTLQQAMDDKATGKLFRERMWEMLMQTFAFNPTPQMFQPLIDVYSNKDAFTGRDIESAGMERMSTGLRSRDTTTAPATALSAVSRVFGDESSIAVSPVQADHLIKGYLGGVGAMAAGWIDTMYRAATGQSSPDKAWSEYQPIRRFYRDLDVPVANTRYATLFYDGLKEANRVYADVMELQKLGRPEDAATLAAEKRNVLQMRIALNAQQRRLTEINNRMKEVRRSDKDGEWKRRELDLLNTQKAMITERMGKRIEDARVGA